ncbi:unnamed protein product [Arctogadus glacialis]
MLIGANYHAGACSPGAEHLGHRVDVRAGGFWWVFVGVGTDTRRSCGAEPVACGESECLEITNGHGMFRTVPGQTGWPPDASARQSPHPSRLQSPQTPSPRAFLVGSVRREAGGRGTVREWATAVP